LPLGVKYNPYQEMNLASFLSPTRTVIQEQCSSKKRAFELIASTLAGDIASVSDEQIFKKLLERERLGCTGIGQGIAIPHCRIEGLSEVTGVLIKLNDALDFEAPDGRAVDLIFALMVPSDATNEHLQALAALAERFNDPRYTTNLRNQTETHQLYSAATT